MGTVGLDPILILPLIPKDLIGFPVFASNTKSWSSFVKINFLILFLASFQTNNPLFAAQKPWETLYFHISSPVAASRHTIKFPGVGKNINPSLTTGFAWILFFPSLLLYIQATFNLFTFDLLVKRKILGDQF